ncbi:MAG TPA: hypothetical protein VFI94_16450 [Pseudolabrys sp.]|nr:hypothetical protein [Pseudolabrys sp.]
MTQLLMNETEKLTNKARDWLFTILRFAVTLERNDRAAVLAIAQELDRPGMGEAEAPFAFFTRTSFEFCNAIADKSDPNRIAVLRRQLSRIDDHRLRRALEGAIDIGPSTTQAPMAGKYCNGDLWKGLAQPRSA